MARQEKPIYIPAGTLVKTPSGITFTVVLCDEVSLYKFVLIGTLHGMVDRRTLAEETLAEIGLIENGVMWPMIGWVVLLMPGFHPIPEVAYVNQIVQSSRLSWVHSAASDRDILLNRSRQW